jgi:hypothetical protein
MAPKKRPAAAAAEEGGGDETGGHPAPEKAKKAKKEKVVIPDHIPQTPAPRQSSAATTTRPTFKTVAWNVAGIRSLLEKNPGMLRKIADEVGLALFFPRYFAVKTHSSTDDSQYEYGPLNPRNQSATPRE